MNFKTILIAMGIAATVGVSAALAESQTSETTSTPAAAASEGGEKNKPPMTFEERKAHKLSNLQKAASSIQQKQACVQAATDAAALDKCFPPRQGKGKGRWHKRDGKDGAEKSGAAVTPEAVSDPEER